MEFRFSLGLSALFLLSCSHAPKVAGPQAPAHYQEMLYQKVGAELTAESNTQRTPATNDGWQLQALKAQLGDLNRVKPGKFEIYVFPKMQAMNHKEKTADNSILLGKPQVSEVSLLALTDCASFVSKNSFAKYNPAKYFDSRLAQDKKNKCAILEVTSRSMKRLNKSLLREGDVISKRLYIDDLYNVYGIETDFYSRNAKQRDLNLRTVGMKLTAGMPSTSGLDFLPVDLPAMNQLDQVNTVDTQSIFSASKKNGNLAYKADGSVVDRLALHQISRLNKNFKVPECSMRKLSYKDHYRKKVEMYWCEGLPWPQVVDSLQFVAVTQNLSVR